MGAANASRTPLRIAGRSHWLRAGRPVARNRNVVACRPQRSSGLRSWRPHDHCSRRYDAGGARTNCRRARAMVPLNPYGSYDGTIGATVATASSGPLAHGFGTIRDLVLGVDVREWRGQVGARRRTRGKERRRLRPRATVTGSWGTLGVITELSLRLYAQPADQMTMRLDAPTDTRRLAEPSGRASLRPMIPFALELLNEGVAAHLGLPRRPTILALLGGNAAAVRAQRDALANWEQPMKCQEKHGTNCVSWRDRRLRVQSLRAANGACRALGADANDMAGWRRESDARLDWSRDSAVHSFRRADAADDRGTVLLACEGYVNLRDTSPAPLDEFSPTSIADRVSQSIRSAFDPLGILNPGILGPSH